MDLLQIAIKSEYALVSFSNFCKVWRRRKFYGILLTRISGMAWGILFKFEMWPVASPAWRLTPCKFGAIWIRHHKAMDAQKPQLYCSCQYIYSVPFSWAAWHTTVCLDTILPCVLVVMVNLCSFAWHQIHLICHC